jgi:hypothetical protein
MGMGAEWRLQIMTKVGAVIMKMAVLKREGEGREWRRRTEGRLKICGERQEGRREDRKVV